MDVGVVGGFKAKLQLYTVPGQVFYNSTRKLVLKGVDGVVFVADSQSAMLEANKESLQNLGENLRELGLELADLPLVFQWNKRDLKQITPVELLEQELNPRGLDSYLGIAREGVGVFETLRGITRLALGHIKHHHLGDHVPAPSHPRKPARSNLSPPVHGAGVATDPASMPVAGAAPVPKPPVVPARTAHQAPAVPVPAAAPAPEALSFLDLDGPSDLFERPAGRAVEAAPAEGAPAGADSAVKVMAPLVVKPLAPAPAKPGTFPAGAGVPVPRVALLPPVAAARSGSVLPLSLPADGEGEPGILEVQVLVRRQGVLLAEATTPFAGPGPQGSATLTIELKRS